MTSYGKMPKPRRNPETMFWAYFGLTLLLTVHWFYYVQALIFGDKTFFGLFGFADWLTWIMVLMAWVWPYLFLKKAIYYHGIMKFGVKSTWRY